MLLSKDVSTSKECNIKLLIRNFLNKFTEDNLEVEARLGKITDKLINDRIRWKILHPIVFKQLPANLQFSTGVCKDDYDIYMNNLNKTLNSNIITDIVSIDKNKNRRIQKDGKFTFEKKTRIADLTIFLPESPYDLRISISKEELSTEIIGFIEQMRRERERTTFNYKELCYDFTNVKSNDTKSKTYEVELEGRSGHFDVETFIDLVMSLPEK